MSTSRSDWTHQFHADDSLSHRRFPGGISPAAHFPDRDSGPTMRLKEQIRDRAHRFGVRGPRRAPRLIRTTDFSEPPFSIELRKRALIRV